MHVKHLHSDSDDFQNYVRIFEIIDTAMTLIADPDCRDSHTYELGISPLTLSLYLMAQCQLKLRHSMAQTLDDIKSVQRRYSSDRILEQLTLKLIVRSTLC